MEREKSSGEMIEQAKEELEMLETQHPYRFGYLKMELKSFIFLLESQYNNNNNNPISLPTYSAAAATQASTSRKRKKDGSESEICKMVCRNGAFEHKRRNRIDLVLEKAQSCLRKIQQLKSSLCNEKRKRK
ncbi:hypothetical protein OWV82_003261 [Melia azedarach]|uniref:Uncharacterized protein n=1 Tax=Melia azedarach TaxID=155640 RepID=A0ACC1YMM4_MELAZ|nr:hypothetical protein OWV82_003261 [Melia azedarach]